MRRTLVALVSGCVILIFAGHATAATAQYSGGLAVSPAIEQLALKKGQNTATFDVMVTNNSLASTVVSAYVDDFTALNSTGSALFLNNTKRLPAPHGLAHWMQPSIGQFALAARSSEKVKVTISDTSTLSPGGHYGAVIFKTLPSANVTKNSLSSNTAISVLVFLTTYNAGSEAVTLSRPQVSTVAVNMPDNVNLVFTNTGDVQTTPYGVAIISDRNGGEVARGIVNVESGLVLPDTSRLYQVQLQTEHERAWPGIYHLRIYYRAGSSTAVSHYDVTFLYVSPLVVSLVTGGLTIMLLFATRHVGGAVRRYTRKA